MAFLKKIETGFGVIGIWKITESLHELESNYILSEKENSELEKMTSEKRKKEFLIVRILSKILLGFRPEITYEKTGKPKLNNLNQNISISHSFNVVVVFISEKNIGTDVENLERNIGKITPRFLHPSEIEFIEKSEDKQRLEIILWSAKEAIFKSCRRQGIQFNRDIIIQPIQIAENEVFFGKKFSSNHTEHFKIWFFYCENNVVVYCVEDEISPDLSRGIL